MGFEWNCEVCSFLHESHGTRCNMCNTIRGASKKQMISFITGGKTPSDNTSTVTTVDTATTDEPPSVLPGGGPAASASTTTAAPKTRNPYASAATKPTNPYAKQRPSTAASTTTAGTNNNNAAVVRIQTNTVSIPTQPPAAATATIAAPQAKPINSYFQPNNNTNNKPAAQWLTTNRSTHIQSSTHQQQQQSVAASRPNSRSGGSNKHISNNNNNNNARPATKLPSPKRPAPGLLPRHQPGSATVVEYTPGPVPLDVNAVRHWVYPLHEKYPVREYQLEMTKSAIEANTLVSLPTGLGKTLIASVVLYNFYRWFPTGKVIFLAPTLPLVDQQVEACYNIMGIPASVTAILNGRVPKDARQELWNNRRVFFCTPQTVEKDLQYGRLDGSQVVCMVLDEAHRATGNFAYTKVVELCEAANARMRIVALSATPGAKVQAVQKVLTALRIAKLEARSEDDVTVKPYIHDRHEEVVIVKKASGLQDIARQFQELLVPIMTKLRTQTSIGQRIAASDATLTTYSIVQAMNYHKQSTRGDNTFDGYFVAAIKIIDAKANLYTHGIGTVRSKLLQLHNNTQRGILSTICKSQAFSQLLESVMRASSGDHSQETAQDKKMNNPKLAKLEEILKEHFLRQQAMASDNTTTTTTTRAIVFSQWRDSVGEIVELLSVCQPLIRAHQFVGQSSGGSSKNNDATSVKGMKQKEQQSVIKGFHEGRFNVLVCTCVGEEGLDVGECDLIVNYDMLRSPIRMIQRVGRTGRKRNGRVVSLVTEGEEEANMKRSKNNERSLQKALKKPKNFQFQSSQPPMFPQPPELKKTLITIDTKFRLSQVGGQANKRKRGDNNETTSIPTRDWRLSEQLTSALLRTFGPVKGIAVSKDKPFPIEVRRNLVRARTRSYAANCRRSQTLEGSSRNVLLTIESMCPPNDTKQMGRVRATDRNGLFPADKSNGDVKILEKGWDTSRANLAAHNPYCDRRGVDIMNRSTASTLEINNHRQQALQQHTADSTEPHLRGAINSRPNHNVSDHGNVPTTEQSGRDAHCPTADQDRSLEMPESKAYDGSVSKNAPALAHQAVQLNHSSVGETVANGPFANNDQEPSRSDGMPTNSPTPNTLSEKQPETNALVGEQMVSNQLLRVNVRTSNPLPQQGSSLDVEVPTASRQAETEPTFRFRLPTPPASSSSEGEDDDSVDEPSLAETGRETKLHDTGTKACGTERNVGMGMNLESKMNITETAAELSTGIPSEIERGNYPNATNVAADDQCDDDVQFGAPVEFRLPTQSSSSDEDSDSDGEDEVSLSSTETKHPVNEPVNVSLVNKEPSDSAITEDSVDREDKESESIINDDNPDPIVQSKIRLPTQSSSSDEDSDSDAEDETSLSPAETKHPDKEAANEPCTDKVPAESDVVESAVCEEDEKFGFIADDESPCPIVQSKKPKPRRRQLFQTQCSSTPLTMPRFSNEEDELTNTQSASECKISTTPSPVAADEAVLVDTPDAVVLADETGGNKVEKTPGPKSSKDDVLVDTPEVGELDGDAMRRELTDTPIASESRTTATPAPEATDGDILVDTPEAITNGATSLPTPNCVVNHTGQLDTPATQDINVDDAICLVCGAGDSPADDPIFFCDGNPKNGIECPVAVHMSCYSLEKQAMEMLDEWYCDACQSESTARCFVCSGETGALKRLDGNGLLVHPYCMTWDSNVDDSTTCQVCSFPGALKCRFAGCQHAAHPHCVHAPQIRSKSRWLTVIDQSKQRNELYCPEHRDGFVWKSKEEDSSSEPCCFVMPTARVAVEKKRKPPSARKERPKKRLRKKVAKSKSNDTPSLQKDKPNKQLTKRNPHQACIEIDDDDEEIEEPECTKKQRIKEKLAQRHRGMLKSCFIDSEAAVNSDDDVIYGDRAEEEEIRRIQDEEELAAMSFINDSSQLDYTQDELDRVDPLDSSPVIGDNGDIHRQVDANLARERQFATPLFNRRMRTATSTQSSKSPSSQRRDRSSSEGLGRMHFIRSVLEHHRLGGDADEIEKVYNELEDQSEEEDEFSPPAARNGHPQTETPRITTVEYIPSDDDEHGKENEVTKPPALTKEMRERIEQKRQEALARKLRNTNQQPPAPPKSPQY